jgi:hypothetical protein
VKPISDVPSSSEQPSRANFDRNFDRGFALVATLVVLASLGAGFWVLGSPDQQRLMALDRQRRQDLWGMANDLNMSKQAQLGKDKWVLPETLSVGTDQSGAPRLRQDPVTQQPYEYKRLSETTYQLCAKFATDTSTYPLRNPTQQRWWHHPKGRHCFKFNVNAPVPADYSW